MSIWGKLGVAGGLVAALVVVSFIAEPYLRSSDSTDAADCKYFESTYTHGNYSALYGFDTPKEAVATKVSSYQDRANPAGDTRTHVIVQAGSSSDWFTVMEDGRMVASFETVQLPNGRYTVGRQVFYLDENYQPLSDLIRPSS